MAIESTSDLQFDFLIVTSLNEEFEALVKTLKVSTIPISNLAGVVRANSCDLPVRLSDDSTSVYRLVVLQQSGIGRVNAAVAASDAIRRFRPRYVLLMGLAGGISKKLDLGDILVADQIVDYERQKLQSIGAEPSWQVYRPDPSLLRGARQFAQTKWSRLIKVKRPVRGTVKVHIGPLASGDKTLISGGETASLLNNLLERWPSLNGVEMEGSGVAAAINEIESPPGFLMIRAVADIVGDSKEAIPDEWRTYAVAAVAAFTIGFLTSVPVPPSQEVAVPAQTSAELGTLSSAHADSSATNDTSVAQQSIDQNSFLDQLVSSRLRLISYGPDTPTGPDLLGVQADVNAFASVIAARTTTPPLSIGAVSYTHLTLPTNREV